LNDDEYIQMAVQAIKRYLQYSADEVLYPIENVYPLAVKRLVMKAKEIDIIKINGVSQYSTDGESYTLNRVEAFDITPDIAILLPKRKRFYAW